MFNCVPKMTLLPVKKEETNHLILYNSFTLQFHILYNFINCPVFIDKNKLCIIKQHQSKFNQRDNFFYPLLSHVCFSFLCWVKFFSGCFRQFFSFGRQKKWQLVTLDRWSYYKVTIVWGFAWADSALVILDEWLSYRSGHLNRFDCIIYYSLFDFSHITNK